MTRTCLKPRLQQTLQSLRLDVSYHRAAGNYLFYVGDDGREHAVLDLVGGYGSLLFGHNHPVLLAEAQRLLASHCAIHAQASRREPAQRLAGALAERAGGDYLSLFSNSGAEAVEAALKHAMLQTGARTFVALERGFHGKTLGALQLTANADFRDPFQLSGIRVCRVAPNDIAALHKVFEDERDLAGCIIEPILGEGGVIQLERAFAQSAERLCAQKRIPLIADECQTGMGRTGSFLASSKLGIVPDYVILSKSLGGGLAKISATLIRRQHYCDEIDLKHTSTYAEDDFACNIALKTLELLDDQALRECAQNGAKLLAQLNELAARYPDVILQVCGQGLLLGLELQPRSTSESFLLRMFTDQSDLGYLVMAYLLHAHQVRVAPTLSSPLTLRLQPSLLFGETEQAKLLNALEDVCQRLRKEDAAGLAKFLGVSMAPLPASTGTRKPKQILVYDRRRWKLRQPAPATQVAWLCHLVDEEDWISLEPRAAELSAGEREKILSHFALRGSPILVSAADVTSATGALLRFHTIVLPFTSRWARDCLLRDGRAQPLIQSGVDIAAELGCSVVSLGQYTSILTYNGLKLNSRGMGLTTGNSYAVALARQAVERLQTERALDPARSTLVVVGAAGNIGRACAQLLGPSYRCTRLVGSVRAGSLQRLRKLAASIPNATVTTNLEAVRDGQVVIVALNAVDAPLNADHFAPDAFVCDLSVPAGLQPDVATLRPDLFFFKGGLARLPHQESLDIVGFPLPLGHVYACMAEGMTLGWEHVRDRRYTGTITAAQVGQIEPMASRHGLSLANYKMDDVFDAERRLFALAN